MIFTRRVSFRLSCLERESCFTRRRTLPNRVSRSDLDLDFIEHCMIQVICYIDYCEAYGLHHHFFLVYHPRGIIGISKN